ncbi:MAG: alpha/beta hydrolase [Gammaproteobacteria bacterium]|nr:alpha/beta hydrolase [Gammaproteobacteria bacterium]
MRRPRSLAWLLALALLRVHDLACAAPLDLDAFEHARRSLQLPNGERLAYVPLGTTQGTPLVLIHGYTDNARDWLPLVPYLPGRRLILVELRGHGGSSAPECCYTRYDFAYDVKLLLDALHIDRADLVGHSLGSLVLQAFAEEWPARARRVVLISSTGGVLPGETPAPPRYDYARAIRELHEPLDPDSPFMLEWWGNPGAVDAEFLRRQRRDSARIPLRVWLAVLDQGLNTAELQAGLRRLTAPALLIWGSEDPLMREPDRRSLRAGLPAARIKIFPGLGHNPFWEDPRGCAEAINDFLGPP